MENVNVWIPSLALPRKRMDVGCPKGLLPIVGTWRSQKTKCSLDHPQCQSASNGKVPSLLPSALVVKELTSLCCANLAEVTISILICATGLTLSTLAKPHLRFTAVIYFFAYPGTIPLEKIGIWSIFNPSTVFKKVWVYVSAAWWHHVANACNPWVNVSISSVIVSPHLVPISGRYTIFTMNNHVVTPFLAAFFTGHVSCTQRRGPGPRLRRASRFPSSSLCIEHWRSDQLIRLETAILFNDVGGTGSWDLVQNGQNEVDLRLGNDIAHGFIF